MCFRNATDIEAALMTCGGSGRSFSAPSKSENTHFFRKNAKIQKNTYFRCHFVFWPQTRVPWFWEPSKISKNNSKGDSGRGAWLFQLNVFEKINILISKRAWFVFLCVSQRKVAFRRECVFTCFTFPPKEERLLGAKTQENRTNAKSSRTCAHDVTNAEKVRKTHQRAKDSIHPSIRMSNWGRRNARSVWI